MSSSVRESVELVQVAAVAVSALEVAFYGSADSQREWDDGESQIDFVLGLIRQERGRQDAKWGKQKHPSELWLVILMEEVHEYLEEMELPDDAAIMAIVEHVRAAGRLSRELLDSRGWGEPDDEETE